jgi:hypothetical protein
VCGFKYIFGQKTAPFLSAMKRAEEDSSSDFSRSKKKTKKAPAVPAVREEEKWEPATKTYYTWRLSQSGYQWSKDNGTFEDPVQQICAMSETKKGHSKLWYLACLEDSVKWNSDKAQGDRDTPFFHTAALHRTMITELDELLEEAVDEKYLVRARVVKKEVEK